MAEYEKVKKAKACKEELHNRIEQYMENKEDIVKNSGQLKFFKDLMVRHLAVSTNIKIQKPSTRVFDFFDHRVCGSNDDIIDLFDHDKNMKAFFESVYCEYGSFSEPFETEYATIPYLLLQKLQEVLEESLKEYIRVGEEKPVKKKESAYLDFLLSVALYEIFIREFYVEIEDKMLAEDAYIFDGREDREWMEKIWKEIKVCKDEEEQKKKIEHLAEYTAQFYEKLCRYSFRIFYIWYFLSQMIKLLAVLRIIALIERVQINKGQFYSEIKSGKSPNPEAIEAKYWSELMKKLLMNGELFSDVERKRNLVTMYKQINTLYKKNRIFPYTDKDISFVEFEEKVIMDVDILKKYLEMIQKHSVGKRTFSEEKIMWEWQAQLAAPILNAANDIMET